MLTNLTLSYDETVIYYYLLLDNLDMISGITLIMTIINVIIAITKVVYPKDLIRIIKQDFLKSPVWFGYFSKSKKIHVSY